MSSARERRQLQQRSQTRKQSALAPAVSSRTSMGEPVRLGMKLWWNSSQLAMKAVETMASRVELRRHESRELGTRRSRVCSHARRKVKATKP